MADSEQLRYELQKLANEMADEPDVDEEDDSLTPSDPWEIIPDFDPSYSIPESIEPDPQTEFRTRRKTFQKDRGWAWMCVLGSFVIQMLMIGAAKSFGVLFAEFVELYNCDITSATWISALNGFLSMSLGPFSTCLGIRYSNRTVVMVGGVLVCVGFVLSAFATSVSMLYGTYGVLVGTGMGLGFAPSIVVLSQYFENRRALANGLAVAGSGVGNFVIPSLYRFLIDNFGLRGCLIIYGGLTLHICVCGALFRPVEEPTHTELSVEASQEKISAVEADSLLGDEERSSTSSWEETSSEILPNYDLPAEQWPEEDCCGCRQCFNCLCFMPSNDPTSPRGRPLFDISLLKNPVFHVYFWAVFFASIGHSSVFVMLPPSAIEHGLSKDRAALLVSIIGATDLVGRVSFGWISDLRLVRRKHGFFLAMALSGAVAMLFPITATNFKYQASVCAVFGLFAGSYIALTAVVLAEALGTKTLPNAFGITVLGQGVAMLMAFPGMGALRTFSGSWNASFYLCSAVLILGSVMALLEPVAQEKTKQTKISSPRPSIDTKCKETEVEECLSQV